MMTSHFHGYCVTILNPKSQIVRQHKVHFIGFQRFRSINYGNNFWQLCMTRENKVPFFDIASHSEGNYHDTWGYLI